MAIITDELNVNIRVMLDGERASEQEREDNKTLHTLQQCACSLFLWRSLTKVIHQIFRSFFGCLHTAHSRCFLL